MMHQRVMTRIRTEHRAVHLVTEKMRTMNRTMKKPRTRESKMTMRKMRKMRKMKKMRTFNRYTMAVTNTLY